MYGNTEGVSGGGYMKPGVHTVKLGSLEVKEIESKSGWKGLVAEVIFKNSSGETVKKNEFEYKYEEGAKDFNGNVMDEVTQWNKYQRNHLNTFKYGCKDYDALVEALGKATDFKSYAACFKEHCTEEFEIRVVGDKNGYSAYFFRGDSAGPVGANAVVFDENNEKHTGPKKDTAAAEVPQGSGGDELPF
jgi:hypothetical protein